MSQYHLKIYIWRCNRNTNSAAAMVSRGLSAYRALLSIESINQSSTMIIRHHQSWSTLIIIIIIIIIDRSIIIIIHHPWSSSVIILSWWSSITIIINQQSSSSWIHDHQSSYQDHQSWSIISQSPLSSSKLWLTSSLSITSSDHHCRRHRQSCSSSIMINIIIINHEQSSTIYSHPHLMQKPETR